MLLVHGQKVRGPSFDGSEQNRHILGWQIGSIRWWCGTRGRVYQTKLRSQHLQDSQAIRAKNGQVPASFMDCIRRRKQPGILQLPKHLQWGFRVVGGGEKHVGVEEESIHA